MTEPSDNADVETTDEETASTPEPRNITVGNTYNVEFDFVTGDQPS